MGTVCRIGLDIAKEYFQVHGVDKHGKDVFNKKLRRNQVLPFFANLSPCVVGLEACGGAHYWAREISKLDAGHTVHLVSPRHVKPFVLNNKTDAADARAICEVVGRPSTRFVSTKTVEQQDLTAWHKMRERKVKERTAIANQARGFLMEQGFVIRKGINYIRKNLPLIYDDLNNDLSLPARDYLSELYSELVACDELIKKYENRIVNFAKNNEACKRLQKIPGIGPITATAIVAHAGEASQYKNGRAFAASLGLTPREHSSGGKQKLLGKTRQRHNTNASHSGGKDNYTIYSCEIMGEHGNSKMAASGCITKGQACLSSCPGQQNRKNSMESPGQKGRIPASNVIDKKFIL